jgi:hypothetical protein
MLLIRPHHAVARPLAAAFLLLAAAGCADRTHPLAPAPAPARAAPAPPLEFGLFAVRTWTGAVSTSYNVAGNWSTGQVPTASDTAVVSGDAAAQFPVMGQNNTVGGVIMQAGALTPSIDIGAFDLTLTSSIDHGATGVILASTGRMIFTGVAKTISGGAANVDYRNARFTGTYSLNTNLTVTGGRIVVQGGRLRNTGHRIRVRPS